MKISSLIAPLVGALLLATATDAAAPAAKPLPQIGPTATYQSFDANSASRSGFSTDARVALYFGSGSIQRSVNVRRVTHPSTGVFCIVPSVPLNFGHIFPIVTVDFTRSRGTGLLVFFRQFVSGQTECSSTEIEIVTVAFSKSSFSPSDDVAFLLLIE